MKDQNFYEKVGFKCGLEIHQRLNTKGKLFCRCNASGNSKPLGIKITRMQRAVAGETGKVDRSTSFESKKSRTFVYNTFSETSCLVDLDEEPPHELNDEALEIALIINSSLNAISPDEIEPMRKEVVDGSDPSAFQRTMLVGYNGSVEIGRKKIKIPTIFLEEESSGIETSDSSVATYNVDRLGVPLIEIDTDPELSNPSEAKETAAKIGMMLRLTQRVQRGIGSIRQDVNVSIKEGERVEIKGMQDLDSMEIIIEREVERQLKLVEIRAALLKKKAKVGEQADLTGIFSNTNVAVIKNSAGNSGAVYGLKLEKFEGVIGTEINPDRRLGSEISDYAKMAGVKGIIHSDEDLKKYGFSEEEVNSVKKRLGVSSGDAFVIVSAKDKTIAKKAIELAKHRAEHAMIGVPLESRAADSKGMITRFMRPLPGGSRMYPETDAKPIQVDSKMVAQAKKNFVDVGKKEAEIEKLLGNKQLSDQMLKSYRLQTFEFILASVKVEPLLVATTLLEKMKELKRQGIATDEISDDVLVYIFAKYEKKEITKTGIEEILKSVPKTNAQVDQVIKGKKIGRISGNELKKLVSSYTGKDKNDLLRKIMSEHRLNVDAEELGRVIAGK